MYRCAWVVALVGCAPVAQEGSLGADLDHQVRRELKGGSLVAAVLRDGEITRFAGYGEVSEDGPVPDEHSPYRVGSLSKTFTALAVMQLVEEGALDLDAPLTDALPSFATGSAPSRPITMRDLLTHQSGLVSDVFVRMLGDHVNTMEQTTALLASQELAAEPGEMWSYSNVGFNVVGHAAQEVSGVPFAELVGSRIFDPCGMDGASWAFDTAVQGFDGGRPADEGSAISTVPAGGAVMSIVDLAGYAQGLLDGGACAGGVVVSPETLASMWAGADVAPISGDPQQGMGFFTDPTGALTGGTPIVGHPGDTLLFHTNFLLAPDLGFAVAVMASERDAGGIVWEVGRALMADEIARETGAPVPEAAPLPEPIDDPDHDGLDAWEGVYTTDLGVLDLRRRGDGLNAGSVRLLPTAEGTYRLRPRVAGVRLPFLVDGIDVRLETIDGRDLLQGRLNGVFQTIGERVEPPPNLFGWDALAGTWEAADTDGGSLSVTEVKLDTDRDGYLWATLELDQLGRTEPFEALLRPLDARRARVEGVGRYRGEVVTVDHGELNVLGARFTPR